MDPKLILIICCIFIDISSEFNVDVTHPIIVSNGADGPGSYFGAAVQILKNKDDLSWVIIGAPRANSTSRNHLNIHEPGVVWRCSLGRANGADSCETVVMDPTEVDRTQPWIVDRKDGGWLGATLSSNEADRFVTCASRWVNQRFTYDPLYNQSEFYLNGICYWRPKQHLVEDLVSDLPPNYRLIPLFRNRNDSKYQGDFRWIYGQAGFSQHVTSENKLILGAPGIENWKGSAILYSDGDQEGLLRNGQPDLFGNIFANSLTVQPELDASFKNHSYFGYSVSSGEFFTPKSKEYTIQYVGGEPRGAYMAGRVIIFNFPKTSNDPLEKLKVINGTQIGSYFGSVICVVDINHDGFDDLLIGAPRFTFQKISIFPANEKLASFKDAKSFIRGDEGVVEVYMSTGADLVRSGVLQGDNRQWSQFGSAISRIGDLNQDKFEDIAIGAPYYDDGRGAVYIYHGSSKGLQAKYSQVIYASQLDLKLRGFGYSISVGVDIDNNGYNDVAVGSIYSGQAVILRTRPAVMFTGGIKTSVTKLPLNATEFQIYSCISYTGYKLPPELVVGVKITTDADSQTSPRVLVKRLKNDEKKKELTYKLVANMGKDTCTELIGEVVRTLVDEQPIKIRQEIFLIDAGSGAAADIRKKRSVDGAAEINIKANGTGTVTELGGKPLLQFCSTCPLMSEQHHNTSISLPIAIQCGDDDKCIADLRIEAGFVEVEPGNNFTIGSSPTVTLVVNVKNFQETAIAPKIIVTFAKRSLKSVPKNCEHVPMELSTSYKCSLGRFLDPNAEASLTMEFDMNDLVAGRQMQENECIFHIDATTSSELVKPAALDLVLPLNATADTHLFANRNDIKFNDQTKLVAQVSSHIYEVRMHGPSSVSSLRLSFQVPVNLTKTQLSTKEIVQVLYAKGEKDGLDVHCQAINGYFYKKPSERSDTEITTADENQSDPDFEVIVVGESKEDRGIRRKREVQPISRILKKKQMTLDRAIHFECSSRFVDCMEIVCLFPEFKPTSRGSVTISLRVPSDTIRELFEDERAQILVIRSTGEVSIPNVADNIQLENEFPDTDDSSTTIYLETPKKVSKWIIMAAVVIGFLLLFLIGLCLYACDCFKRNKHTVETAEDEDEVDGVAYVDPDDDDEVPTHIPKKPSLSDGLEPIREEHED